MQTTFHDYPKQRPLNRIYRTAPSQARWMLRIRLTFAAAGALQAGGLATMAFAPPGHFVQWGIGYSMLWLASAAVFLGLLQLRRAAGRYLIEPVLLAALTVSCTLMSVVAFIEGIRRTMQ